MTHYFKVLKPSKINQQFQDIQLHQKMKFSIKDFFSKCDQVRSFQRIWSHLLKKSLMENFIFVCSDSPAFIKTSLSNELISTCYQHQMYTALKVCKYGVFFWSVFSLRIQAIFTQMQVWIRWMRCKSFLQTKHFFFVPSSKSVIWNFHQDIEGIYLEPSCTSEMHYFC